MSGNSPDDIDPVERVLEMIREYRMTDPIVDDNSLQQLWRAGGTDARDGTENRILCEIELNRRAHRPAEIKANIALAILALALVATVARLILAT